jgi:hypothetical protein
VSADAVAALDRSLERLRAVLADVGDDQLGLTVPSCLLWNVRTLIAHLLVDLEQFVPMTRGDGVGAHCAGSSRTLTELMQ